MFTYYKYDTGEICGHVFSSQGTECFWILDYPDCALIEGDFSRDTHYVKEGVAVLRREIQANITPLSIRADGLESVVISNLPNQSTVMVDETSYQVTDGIFEFTVDLPGTYAIKLEVFPYLPKEWEVVAV